MSPFGFGLLVVLGAFFVVTIGALLLVAGSLVYDHWKRARREVQQP